MPRAEAKGQTPRCHRRLAERALTLPALLPLPAAMLAGDDWRFGLVRRADG